MTVRLNNGVEMPILGLGVYLSKEGNEVVQAVKWALNMGYRHIDTAAIYRNEKGVGEGIEQSDVDREDVFLVSKVWNSDQGYDSTIRAFDESLKKLNTDYLDLYLVHWPVEGKYKDTWRALEYLYEQKKVKAIGVSNFLKHHLEDLLAEAKITPMVNQMEFHPYLLQNELRQYCNQKGIQYEAWSPLMQGKIFNIDLLNTLSKKYDKTIAQLVLRWNIQHGVVTIPKTVHMHRLKENFNVFDFSITDEDMMLINGLDRFERVGPDPDNFDF